MNAAWRSYAFQVPARDVGVLRRQTNITAESAESAELIFFLGALSGLGGKWQKYHPLISAIPSFFLFVKIDIELYHASGISGYIKQLKIP
jgi:hypothetical protein